MNAENDPSFREYRTADRTDWTPGGKWEGEPDKRQWTDPETRLPCLAVRGPGGHWCGYVGVAEAHPLHRVEYDQNVELPPALIQRLIDDRGVPDLYSDHVAAGKTTPETLFDVHGGLTFSDGCGHSEDPARGVCHIPAPGEPDDVWWFGFDCAHCDDDTPRSRWGLGGGVYRTLEYVTSQCTGLAQQLALVADSVLA